MDTLEIVIQSLTSDEVRRFKILSNRFKADEEKKLIILFDAIRSEKYAGRDDLLLMDLYGSTDAKTKNRYYRLRNKLLDNIEKSLVFYHFKYKDSIHAYYDIQLAVMFKERGNYEIARYFLKKGQKKALALDQFNILEIIYGEYVQLAIKNIDIDIEEIIQKRKDNLAKLEIHRKNTEAIAIIKQQLKKSRFSKSRGSVLDLLDQLKQQIEASEDIFHSTEGKILIFQTVSTILHSKGAYRQMAEYLYQIIGEFEEKKLFNKDNHSTRLLMRLRLIISLYKTYRLEEAMKQLELLESEMKMFQKQNYQTYLFNYLNIKIYSLKTLGKSKEALSTMEAALKLPEVKNNPMGTGIILISKAGTYFNLRRYGDAMSTIEEIMELKSYVQMDIGIRFQLDIFKMVVHYELGDYQYNLDFFKTFRKRYKKLLKADEGAKAARFVELIVRMSNAEIEGKRVSLKSAYKNFDEAFDRLVEAENEILDPHKYLRSKLEKRPYHDIFREEMKKRISQG